MIRSMKLGTFKVIIIFICLSHLVLAQKKSDSLINDIDQDYVIEENDSSKDRGFQQNINLSFVHYYADFFRSNEMGSHMNLGYGIKPKLKHFEIITSFSFTKTRVEEGSRVYNEFHDKWLLISMLGIGYCVPVPYHHGLMELRLSFGPQAMTFFDVKTIYGIFSAINIRFYFPSAKSNPNLKFGIYSEFRDHTYSLFGNNYLWDEYLKSKKDHVSRDGVFLLGFIMGFGDFN